MKNILLDALNGFATFEELVNESRHTGAILVHGAQDAQKLHMLACLQRRLNRPLLIIAPNDIAAQRAFDDIFALTDGAAALLPPREISLRMVSAASGEVTQRRLNALGMARAGALRALIAPIDALMNKLMLREDFDAHAFTLSTGQEIGVKELSRRLVAAGYARLDIVEEHGEFAVRGGIMDVFPIGANAAVRLEFFDDEIDTMRLFDVLSQRSSGHVGEIAIYPAREVLLSEVQLKRLKEQLLKLDQTPESERREDPIIPPWEDDDILPDIDALSNVAQVFLKPQAERGLWVRVAEEIGERGYCANIEALISLALENTHSVADYLDDPIIVLDQPDRIFERASNVQLEYVEQLKSAMERGEATAGQTELLYGVSELLNGFRRRSVISCAFMPRDFEEISHRLTLDMNGRNAPSYMGNFKEMTADIAGWMQAGMRVMTLTGGMARATRLEKALHAAGIYPRISDTPDSDIKPGEAMLLIQSLSRGFIYEGAGVAVLTTGDISAASRLKGKARRTSGEKISVFSEIAPGDYIVHEAQGIGLYVGTVRMQSEGTYRDYLHIKYAGADALYVPTDQMDRVQKYIGPEGIAPRVNKLSGGEWQKKKAKIKAAIREMAGELVQLYAQRQATKGHAFPADTPWQREFEDNFQFDETPDQLKAVDEIKADMRTTRVMDRLLCGDVGYGKTEVALRAAFLAVMDSKQVAILAPTTILVEQHYKTILKRFEGFPVKAVSISRFKTAHEQKMVIKAMTSGEVDIVVGTHRLLSKDVRFKDLGLLIVDEEHRFGVAHKEAIKQLKNSVDVLTLSATPIPRTMSMSMAGIRDMSVLETPPEERYPVQTYVIEYSESMIRDAIMREIGRGGQVYFLYNRVSSIARFHEHLRQLVPEARIGIGHGQMREHELEDIMMDFYEHRFDVLLCTTIIESGLDVPLANTLIVYDADRFGLSQLYQIRGRVGRSNRLAYAYFTVRKNKVLTETAEKRLTGIREFTQFGSGFRIAMRDLEIRGAGNLLGAEQSGHLSSIGYGLYVKMIEETVHEITGRQHATELECRMEIPIDAYLPGDYVQNDVMRMEIYKRIAGITDAASRGDIEDELTDRFGDMPPVVVSLVDIAHLKAIAQRLSMGSVVYKAGQLNFQFDKGKSADLNLEKLIAALTPLKKQVILSAGKSPALIMPGHGREVKTIVKQAIPIMQTIADTVCT